jgi:G3E family GTPase
MPPVLLGCVSGFLGAGKTTAMAAAAREILARGYRVGLITNDQGQDLVDTAYLRSLGLTTEEVAGGCFCCRFDDLVDRAGRLIAEASVDVLLAEAVGSCTDIAATVYRPLRRFFRERFDLAPLTVLVEPHRLQETLGAAFPDEVAYIFDRQLAEADLVLLNKVDLVEPERRQELERGLRARLGRASVLGISATRGTGVGAWVDLMLGGGEAGERGLDVDYAAYARGEAALGWLNTTLEVRADLEVAPRELGLALLTGLSGSAQRRAIALPHAKVLVATAQGSVRVAVTSTTATPQWSGGAELGPARELSAIVNARAGTDPDTLATLVRAAMGAAGARLGARIHERHFECFSPRPPVPRHRLPASAAEG